MKHNIRLQIKSLFKNIFRKSSFSQNGEDRVLMYYLRDIKKGTYVDVGCFHPQMYSNTCLLYNSGWQGINIDANPDHLKDFKKLRTRDVNINVGVGKEAAELDYYSFNKPAVNSFNEKHVAYFKAQKDFHVEKVIKVQVLPLSTILSKYLSPTQTIHFMNVDVEGMDLEVLSSNDWEKFRPQFLLVEDLSFNEMSDASQSQVHLYLSSKAYTLISKMVNSLLYKDTKLNGTI